jgi:hypothetical protein
MASAKFAKTTVNHSQSVIWKLKPLGCMKHAKVVRIAPMKTTNITGFRIWMRGSSFVKDSITAARSSAGSVKDVAFLRVGARRAGAVMALRLEYVGLRLMAV